MDCLCLFGSLRSFSSYLFVKVAADRALPLTILLGLVMPSALPAIPEEAYDIQGRATYVVWLVCVPHFQPTVLCGCGASVFTLNELLRVAAYSLLLLGVATGGVFFSTGL